MKGGYVLIFLSFFSCSVQLIMVARRSNDILNFAIAIFLAIFLAEPGDLVIFEFLKINTVNNTSIPILKYQHLLMILILPR